MTSAKPLYLSPSESLFWKIEEKSPGSFRILAVFHLEGYVVGEYLAIALDRIQHRHPKLRAAIVRHPDGRNSYQVQDAPLQIPFGIVEYSGQEAPWREEARRLLATAFPPTGPFAAVRVLNSVSQCSSVLLVSIHHAVADGLSTIMLVNELLSEYAGAESQKQIERTSPLSVICGSRAQFPGGMRGATALFRRFLGNQREEKLVRVTPLPRAENIPPLSQWTHWIFPRDETRRLVLRCRKEQTSLGGVLVAAACCGLMDCLPVLEGYFKCQFPLNLRDSIQGPLGAVTPEDLGCFVSIMNAFCQVSSTSAFWDVARSSHQDVKFFTKHGGPSAYYNLLAFAFEMGRRFPKTTRKAIPNGNRLTLFATNYGVLNMRDAYGTLRPTGATLVFRNEEDGPALILESLVLGQQLNIGLAADGLQPAFWDILNAAVRKRLDFAIQG